MSYANCEKHGRQFFTHYCEECKKELENEILEQSRLLGISGEREARLLAVINEKKKGGNHDRT